MLIIYFCQQLCSGHVDVNESDGIFVVIYQKNENEKGLSNHKNCAMIVYSNRRINESAGKQHKGM